MLTYIAVTERVYRIVITHLIEFLLQQNWWWTNYIGAVHNYRFTPASQPSRDQLVKNLRSNRTDQLSRTAQIQSPNLYLLVKKQSTRWCSTRARDSEIGLNSSSPSTKLGQTINTTTRAWTRMPQHLTLTWAYFLDIFSYCLIVIVERVYSMSWLLTSLTCCCRIMMMDEIISDWFSSIVTTTRPTRGDTTDPIGATISFSSTQSTISYQRRWHELGLTKPSDKEHQLRLVTRPKTRITLYHTSIPDLLF